MKRCVIFGAAPVVDPQPLGRYLRDDDWFVAADGGNRLAQALGILPALTVADHDSSDSAESCGECVELPIEKDVTDTRAAMDIAYERGYRDFLLLGCMGGRMDHTVANLLSARQMTEKGCSVVLADEKNAVTVLLPSEYPLPQDSAFSVFSMTDCTEGLTMRGVQYPLEGFSLRADDPLCVSNHVIAAGATLSFENGVLLLMFSED